MDRRRFLLTSLAGALAAPLAAEAQQAGKVPTVGILRWIRDSEQEKALRDALSDNGHVDGRSVAIVERWADGRSDLAAQHAAEFIQLNADVIVAAGTPAVQAAWRATRTIPIVMTGSADPVASGFAASLARPGGNVTGNSWNLPALAGKRLQLLQEALPDASRVAFLGSRLDPAARLFVEETQRAGRQLGAHIHLAMVNDTKDFDTALSTAVRDRVSALIVQPIFGYGETLRVIVRLTHKYRLPSISDFPEFASAGGLLSYGPHRREAMQRMATYIDMILKGAKPATLPIQEPTTFELVINLKTAKTLGLTIPPSLLARADQVIE